MTSVNIVFSMVVAFVFLILIVRPLEAVFFSQAGTTHPATALVRGLGVFHRPVSRVEQRGIVVVESIRGGR